MRPDLSEREDGTSEPIKPPLASSISAQKTAQEEAEDWPGPSKKARLFGSSRERRAPLAALSLGCGDSGAVVNSTVRSGSAG